MIWKEKCIFIDNSEFAADDSPKLDTKILSHQHVDVVPRTEKKEISYQRKGAKITFWIKLVKKILV